MDLTELPVIDAHCHGFTAANLMAQPAATLLDRVTIMGMCFGSAMGVDPALSDTVTAMTDSTMIAMVTRRWLADYLDATPETVASARAKALQDDPQAYVSGLMRDANVSDLIVDDGFPLPMVDQIEMQQLVGTPIHRVARIEPMIEAAKSQATDADQFEDAVRASLEAAASDPRTIAYKSIIAYRTGLDITLPDRDSYRAAFDQWKASGWKESRQTSKPVRDHLMNVLFEVAKPHGLPIHIHSGAGDTDVVLAHAHSTGLADLLTRNMDHPVLLIHSGYPWLSEAIYLASLYPLVYLELSLHLPWAMLNIDAALTEIIGNVPTDKILYGSDEASEPELIWLTAKVTRAALGRVLQRAVEYDMLTQAEAMQIAANILSGNAKKLHGLG